MILKLFEILYRPGEVFAGLQKHSWIAPLLASFILALLSGLVVARAIGMNTLMHQAGQIPNGPRHINSSEVAVAIYWGIVGKALLGIIGLLLFSAVILALWRVLATPMSYHNVLAVCSYAAYLKELVRFVMSLGTALYCEFAGVPLTSATTIRTNASVFLEKATAGPLYAMAKSLDVLTVGFLVVVAFGLCKTVPKVRFYTAALTVFAPWVAWVLVGMGLAARRR